MPGSASMASQRYATPHFPSTTVTDAHQVDYKKLADLAGMTNPASASNAWAKIKKKIQAQAEEGGAVANGEEGTPKPKATPSKKRAKAKADQDDGESPAKKSKGGRGKKAASAEAEDGESLVKPEPEEDDS